MASFYFDTSAFVKMYIEEDGTAEVVRLSRDAAANSLVALEVTFLESRAAVRRREREGDLQGSNAERIIRQILADRSSRYLVQPLSSEVTEEAARLLDSHPLRTLDALQLAGCLTVRQSVPAPLTFVCADTRLCEAAALEGLTVLNPMKAD